MVLTLPVSVFPITLSDSLVGSSLLLYQWRENIFSATLQVHNSHHYHAFFHFRPPLLLVVALHILPH